MSGVVTDTTYMNSTAVAAGTTRVNAVNAFRDEVNASVRTNGVTAEGDTVTTGEFTGRVVSRNFGQVEVRFNRDGFSTTVTFAAR